MRCSSIVAAKQLGRHPSHLQHRLLLLPSLFLPLHLSSTPSLFTLLHTSSLHPPPHLLSTPSTSSIPSPHPLLVLALPILPSTTSLSNTDSTHSTHPPLHTLHTHLYTPLSTLSTHTYTHTPLHLISHALYYLVLCTQCPEA